jgi:hypothetical protein
MHEFLKVWKVTHGLEVLILRLTALGFREAIPNGSVAQPDV